jgi:hypothetical protein
MLESTAFVAIVTAAITSSPVERARREHTTPADLEERLRIEQLAVELADIKHPAGTDTTNARPGRVRRRNISRVSCIPYAVGVGLLLAR